MSAKLLRKNAQVAPLPQAGGFFESSRKKSSSHDLLLSDATAPEAWANPYVGVGLPRPSSGLGSGGETDEEPVDGQRHGSRQSSAASRGRFFGGRRHINRVAPLPSMEAAAPAGVSNPVAAALADDEGDSPDAQSLASRQINDVIDDTDGGNGDSGQSGHDQLSSSEEDGPPLGLEGQPQAYVPYHLAKEWVAKMSTDMKAMKSRYLRILAEMEQSYEEIEADTEKNFQAFVQRLRDQYEEKIQSLRHIILLRQQDMSKREGDWKNMVENLVAKNKTLAKNKKELLTQIRELFTRLEEEKEGLQQNLGEQVKSERKQRLSEVAALQSEHADEMAAKEQLLNTLRETHSAELASSTATWQGRLQEEADRHAAEVINLSAAWEEKLKEQEQLKSQQSTSTVIKESVTAVHSAPVQVVQKQSYSDQQFIEQEEKLQSACLQLEQIAALSKTLSSEKDELKSQLEENKAQLREAETELIHLQQKITRFESETDKDSDDVLVELEEKRRTVLALKAKVDAMNVLAYGEVSELVTSAVTVQPHRPASTPTPSTQREDSDQAAQQIEEECALLARSMQQVIGQLCNNVSSEQWLAKLQTAEEEKDSLLARLEELQQSISDWESTFITEHEQEPTNADRPCEIVEASDKALSLRDDISSKQALCLALTALQSGQLPSDFRRWLQLPVGDAASGTRSRPHKQHRTVVSDDESAEEADDETGEFRRVFIDTEQVNHLREQLEKANEELMKTRGEISSLHLELAEARQAASQQKDEVEREIALARAELQEELKHRKQQLVEAQEQVRQFEEERLRSLPVDSAEEVMRYRDKLMVVETDLESQQSLLRKEQTALHQKEVELASSQKQLQGMDNLNKEMKSLAEKAQSEHRLAVAKLKKQVKEQEQEQAAANEKIVAALKAKISSLERQGGGGGGGGASKGKGKVTDDVKKMQSQLKAAERSAQDAAARVKQLEKELAQGTKGASSVEDKREQKKREKEMKDLHKQTELLRKQLDNKVAALHSSEEEVKNLKKELSRTLDECQRLKADMQKVAAEAKLAVEHAEQVKQLQEKLKTLETEQQTLLTNYNNERVLRKKYYNMIEDMKGKIRVYCRARPLSSSELKRGNVSAINSPDEYTIVVQSARGPKEFSFDQVFTPTHTQEQVFEDTNNLIQSAMDGYNVCIFAYGQTGSGKTYTMIGGETSMEAPSRGITPRAFRTIFGLIEANRKAFSCSVSCYMLELYNDRLLDLFAPAKSEPAKLDIKKDKKGMVFVSGSITKQAKSAEELFTLFEHGSENRHVASTKMNATSSRSHLVIGVVITSTNLSTGSVTSGKLSLVDLAGSERASKTEASPEQLKEAQSINKSLSALGDVISALSSGQGGHIPYRNNKLTMLMQDSLGGNAKTLMFVNISPADYNADETVISLTYASRVKLITNDASKNADNKEIARLKDIISKLRHGERLDDDEI